MVSNTTDERYNTLEKNLKKLAYEKRLRFLRYSMRRKEIFGYLGIDTLKFIAKRVKLTLQSLWGGYILQLLDLNQKANTL